MLATRKFTHFDVAEAAAHRFRMDLEQVIRRTSYQLRTSRAERRSENILMCTIWCGLAAENIRARSFSRFARALKRSVHVQSNNHGKTFTPLANTSVGCSPHQGVCCARYGFTRKHILGVLNKSKVAAIASLLSLLSLLSPDAVAATSMCHASGCN